MFSLFDVHIMSLAHCIVWHYRHVDIENFGYNVQEHFLPLSMKPGIARDHD